MDITARNRLAPAYLSEGDDRSRKLYKAAEYLGTTESRLSKEIKAFEKTMKTKRCLVVPAA